MFKHLSEAGLTLRGAKCHIGMTTVQYLGHVFSAGGMSPDPKEVQVVLDWPTPNRYVSSWYYRRYIQHFANIAAPLYCLIQAGTTFLWDKDCSDAFATLK